MRRLTSTLLVSFIVIAVAAAAHEGATGVVKERMHAMSSFAAAVKTIKAEAAKGDGYDSAVVANQAQTIEVHAGEPLVALYPEGSARPPSEARLAIWSDPGAFAAASEILRKRAAALATAADEGADIQAQFKALAQACAACHRKFRASRK